MADDKELNIKIKYSTDPSGAKEAEKTNDRIKSGAKEGAKEADAAAKSMMTMGKVAGQLFSAGAALAAVGGAMVISAKGYVAQVGTGEQVARRWLGATKEMEQAQLRIGRVVAKELAPAMEQVADLTEKAATFVEKHPEAAKIAVGTGGTLLAAGTLMIGASGVMKGVESIKGLFGAEGLMPGVGRAATGAGKGLRGLLGGTAGAVAGGIGLGLLGNDLLAGTEVGQSIGMQKTNKFLTVGAYGAGKLFGGEELGLKWAKSVGEWSGAIEKTGAVAQKASKEIDFSAEEIKAYYQYQRQEQVAERERSITLYRMERDFKRQIKYEDEDFYRMRARAARDFQRQEAYAEQDFYRQRAIAVRDFNIQMARSEEDFQRARKRAEEDYEFGLWDILRSGDALSFMRYQRQYNISRQRAEEDYQIQRSRSEEDFARQQADQAREFEIQRARRQEEFSIRIADEQQDFDIRRQRALEQYKIQLDDYEVSFNEQKLARRQALLDTLRDLRGNLEQERILRQEFSAAMLADLQAAVQQGAQGTNLYAQGSRAVGGYVTAGLWKMHDDEFVLNGQTTQMAERLASGKLNQDKVLSLLAYGANGGGGKASVTWNDNRRFDSNLSAEDRRAIRKDTEAILTAALS